MNAFGWDILSKFTEIQWPLIFFKGNCKIR